MAIKDTVGDGWEERVVVKTNYGPVQEVFHVPGKPENGEAVRNLYWWAEFGGSEYGAYIRVLEDQIAEVLDHEVELLYEQACHTIDSLADEAAGIKWVPLPIYEMFQADSELMMLVGSDLGWLRGCDWREIDLDLQRFEKFWHYRASRRKHLMEEFGLDWRASNKSSEVADGEDKEGEEVSVPVDGAGRE